MIIYLTRHGESIFNVKKLLGGNSGLFYYLLGES